MTLKGSPKDGLFGATLGFFIGFAAVALFGPTAKRFQEVMELSPVMVGFLIAAPALSGSLLRIPFSAWVDTTGGRKPFLTLLSLSVIGMAGLTAVVLGLYPDHMTRSLYPLLLVLALLCGCGIATFSVGISQVSYWFPRSEQGRALAIFGGVGNLGPGLFSLLIPLALSSIGLGGSYLVWLVLLVIGTALYFKMGRNAWFFQLLQAGQAPDEARSQAREAGQELFPAGSLKDSMRISIKVWKTWALVWIYFTTFGGFIALTAWLPTYWTEFHGVTPVVAGLLTAVYSLLSSLIRVIGGVMTDKLYKGGENTITLSLIITLIGALVMTMSDQFELALPGIILMAIGMGVTNAAVFKIVPQAVPQAVGGAAGWVGGLGAFGGFVIPPMMAFAVSDLGQRGYSIGFVVFVYLTISALLMAWILKYAIEAADEPPTSLAR